MINSFPKIFALGSRLTENIFDGEVEVTEKIDGSQFCFGVVRHELIMRTKGQVITRDTADKLFITAVDYVESIRNRLPNNMIFYCEYLKRPRHNVLKYGRVPKNNLMLFGVSILGKRFFSDHNKLCELAEALDIEAVPLLMKGKLDDPENLKILLSQDSVLGNVKIEGIVIKNYKHPSSILAAKYVSDRFKEVKSENRRRKGFSKDHFEEFKQQFRTEARWQKAVQHLKEKGELEGSPKDIGSLLKEIYCDIEAEEQEYIKDGLYRLFKKEILQCSTKGFAEWYKEQLANNAFST
jgi:hypothetical protein